MSYLWGLRGCALWGGAHISMILCPMICISGELWRVFKNVFTSSICSEWSVLSEVLSVSDCQPARSIYFHNILVELANLHYSSGALPPLGVVAREVLEVDIVTYFQSWELSRVFRPLFMLP